MFHNVCVGNMQYAFSIKGVFGENLFEIGIIINPLQMSEYAPKKNYMDYFYFQDLNSESFLSSII